MIQSDFMTQAIAAARLGTGLTYRNPLVGAVIVKNDHVLAVGHHVGFGHAHAEVDAYQHVAHPEDVIDSTMYVTLEPCSHYGKTPPCAHQIVKWGVKEVFVAQQDPNPIVGGKGIAYLRDHGVQVHVGMMAHAARQLNRAYNFYYERQRPLITVKVAQSLDGKLSLNDGKRTYLTDATANADVDALRGTQQAILVGSQTVLDDDPQLVVKHQLCIHRFEWCSIDVIEC
ncbi:MAG TPA: bifunctional diaminohydroxyphosphoribosylaminopyrimidine deaminase/5-amino-6-(5-phosphoribosylamino)uracil reductase RibD [Lactobacillus sp.]|nr:bifunctional diaminohydroxyphosphoribosylaminopyrimidine deaminase/5-amino-6-(5-phosphoribosylamino)uracil reductase RibD [Lactobacillus sp.]